MTIPLTMKSWSPYVVGVGVLSWFAFVADHPLGISTAFEHTAALIEGNIARDKTAGHSKSNPPVSNPRIPR